MSFLFVAKNSEGKNDSDDDSDNGKLFQNPFFVCGILIKDQRFNIILVLPSTV